MEYFILGVILVFVPPIVNDLVHYIQEKKYEKRR